MQSEKKTHLPLAHLSAFFTKLEKAIKKYPPMQTAGVFIAMMLLGVGLIVVGLGQLRGDSVEEETTLTPNVSPSPTLFAQATQVPEPSLTPQPSETLLPTKKPIVPTKVPTQTLVPTTRPTSIPEVHKAPTGPRTQECNQECNSTVKLCVYGLSCVNNQCRLPSDPSDSACTGFGGFNPTISSSAPNIVATSITCIYAPKVPTTPPGILNGKSLENVDTLKDEIDCSFGYLNEHGTSGGIDVRVTYDSEQTPMYIEATEANEQLSIGKTLPLKKSVGTHEIKFELNYTKKHSESSYDDNTKSLQYTVVN